MVRQPGLIHFHGLNAQVAGHEDIVNGIDLHCLVYAIECIIPYALVAVRHVHGLQHGIKLALVLIRIEIAHNDLVFCIVLCKRLFQLRELHHTHFRVLITEMRIVESDLSAFLYKH